MFYYSLNGQQQGPVTETQLRQLVAAGTLREDALIWREGMPEWQPFSAILGGGAAASVPCSVCKQTFPIDQTIQYGDEIVCAGCKPQFVQALKEGVGNSGQNLYAIAINQRRLLLTFGFQILCNATEFFVGATGAAAPIVAVAALILWVVGVVCSIIFMYRLASALSLAGVLYAILMIFPCIGLITLLIVSSRATKALKTAGVKVGLFGVSSRTIAQLKAA
jgi:hypothetical protein